MQGFKTDFQFEKYETNSESFQTVYTYKAVKIRSKETAVWFTQQMA